MARNTRTPTRCPVAAIRSNGPTLRGIFRAGPEGGSFNVTDGKLSCAGSYGPSLERTISMPVLCSDGRKGIVISTRDGADMSGHGHVRMTDGTDAEFLFGRPAENF